MKRLILLHYQNLISFALIGFFLAFNYLSMQNLSITFDEGRHYQYGTNVLNGNTDRLINKSGYVDNSKMPITALNAIPAKIAARFPGRFRNFLTSMTAARFVTVLFSALIAWLIFSWSRSLYGFLPGMASLLLYILDPNIIAHSQLITNDLYLAGTVTFCIWSLWRFANHRTWQNGLLLAFALGLSQVAKYTALAMYPLSLLCLLIYDMPMFLDAFRKKRFSVLGGYLWKYIVYGVLILAGSLLVINLWYLFNRTFTDFGNYTFESNLLQMVQINFPFSKSAAVPVPYPYLQGLDLMLGPNILHGSIYLLGQLHPPDVGFPGYYFVASLLKVPIATQVIVFASVIAYLYSREWKEHFLNHEMFIFIPVLFYVIYFNFFLNAQIGIRYYLIVFILLYVFAGSLFHHWQNLSMKWCIASAVLLCYLVGSVLSYFPHYISYFNEFIWDRRMAYQYLADSNLDWGQNQYYLKQYLHEHPQVIYAPSHITAGRIVVSANDLVGVQGSPDQYAWLRENFEPVDTVAYSYLVYDVSQQDLSRLCATKKICQ